MHIGNRSLSRYGDVRIRRPGVENCRKTTVEVVVFISIRRRSPARTGVKYHAKKIVREYRVVKYYYSNLTRVRSALYSRLEC